MRLLQRSTRSRRKKAEKEAAKQARAAESLEKERQRSIRKNENRKKKRKNAMGEEENQEVNILFSLSCLFYDLFSLTPYYVAISGLQQRAAVSLV